MTELHVYHGRGKIAPTVAQLLFKHYQDQKFVAVFDQDHERLKKLDDFLWTFSDETFLPHAMMSQDNMDSPLILFNNLPHSLNDIQRDLLLLSPVDNILKRFDRQIYLVFTDQNNDMRSFARELWVSCRQLHLPAYYFRQDTSGDWASSS